MLLKNIFFMLLLSLSIYMINVYLAIYFVYEYTVFVFDTNTYSEEYDFIIVGSGTAGSLIAHYLSQTNAKFLVLEAGGSGGPLLNAPALGPILHGTNHDWKHKTIKQYKACLAMDDDRCVWPSGKIVGGSAKINNMVHIKSFVDEIVPWFGGKYSYEQILTHLIQLENVDLPVDKLKYKTELSPAILKAASDLGYKTVNQTYKTKFGFMEAEVNQYNGARWSTAHTMSLFHLNNGELVTNAFVEKILFDEVKKVANGVVFDKFGKRFEVKVNNGVILSAGTVGTSKLLLLSGIGPEEHLSDLNIPVINNLPVGLNLIDHVSTGLDMVLLEKSLGLDVQNLFNPINIWNYYINGNGPWTTTGCEVVAFFNTNNIESELPDLQFMVLPLGLATDFGGHLYKAIGITDEIWDDYFSKVSNMNPISILPIVLHPKSTGDIKLNSDNPQDPPLINPNYLSDERDVDVIMKGIKIIKELIETKPMQALGAKLNSNKFPGCEYYIFDTYEYWECYIRHLTLTTFHPAGTCQMGDPLKDTTVVDYNFNVVGIENLFVVDASVFPTLPSGNINTAVALLAKMFSEELINKYNE